MGYLQGRLRALEDVADLRKLVSGGSDHEDRINTDRDNDSKLSFEGCVEACSPEQNIIIKKIKVFHGQLQAKVVTVGMVLKDLINILALPVC